MCPLKKNFTGHGDKGYDASSNFVAISKLGGKAQIAMRHWKGASNCAQTKIACAGRLNERANAWGNQFRAVEYCHERLCETAMSLFF